MLKRATVAQMLTPQGKDEDGDGWGLGIILNGSGRALRFSHSGGTVGFRCVMVAYPATGQGAVVMTNSLNGAGLYREVLRAIAHEYGWPEYLPTRRVAGLTPLRNQREAGTSLLIADSNLAL
jgi:CubicO group peptidase (beta-lactamase class C family)